MIATESIHTGVLLQGPHLHYGSMLDRSNRMISGLMFLSRKIHSIYVLRTYFYGQAADKNLGPKNIRLLRPSLFSLSISIMRVSTYLVPI